MTGSYVEGWFRIPGVHGVYKVTERDRLFFTTPFDEVEGQPAGATVALARRAWQMMREAEPLPPLVHPTP